MKKPNFIYKAMGAILVAACMIGSANAQTPPEFGTATNEAAYWDSTDPGFTYQDSVTVNDTVPYFVMPDPVLNENFTSAYDTSLVTTDQGIESTWNWWTGSNDGAEVDSVKQFSYDQHQGPYIHVSTESTGEDTIYVQEVSSTGCTGDTTSLPVHVIEQPEFTVANAEDTTRLCAGAGNQPIDVNNIADNGVQGGNLKFNMDIQVDTLNSDQTVDDTVRTSYDTVVQISESNVGGGATLMNYNTSVVNGQITQYTFAFANNMSTNNNPNENGMSDHISRKSDFLKISDANNPADQEFTYYQPTDANATAKNKVYIIFPAPDTGPLYHVPNSYDK